MIRYGILGFGLHAVRHLMPGFALATNNRVTALSRRDLKQAQASAAEYRIPHAFDPPRCSEPSANSAKIQHLLETCNRSETGLLDLCRSCGCGWFLKNDSEQSFLVESS